MSLRADTTYTGTVVGAEWMQSNKGTSGLSIHLETDDGSQITHVLWITPKTKDYFQRDMTEALGVPLEKLSDGPFLQHELPTFLAGREVQFGTKAEVYNGMTKVKVAWIGAKRVSDPRGAAYSVAQLFGGTVSAPEGPITEDDIPF